MTSPPYSDLPEVHPTSFPELTPAETTFGTNIVDLNFPQSYAIAKNDAVGSEEQADLPTGLQNDGHMTRRICGLGRRLFFVLAALGVLVIIGGVVGGAVGGTVGKDTSKSKSTSGSSSNDTAGTSSISATPGIASVDYTDSSGRDYYYVFHQDQNNEIIASRWDSQNKTWQARVVKTAEGSLDIIKNTPITAVAWSDDSSGFNLQVFFLVSDNLLTGLNTSETSIEAAWSQHELGSLIPPINPGSGSSIAACHPNGGNGSWPPTLMVWQNNDQAIIYSNSLDWANVKFFNPLGVNGTSLAATSIGNSDEVGWRFYFDNSNVLQEYSIPSDFSASDPHYGSRFDTLAPGVKSRITATGFEGNYILLVNLEEDGSAKARWWTNSPNAWEGPSSPTLLNLPKGMSDSPKFTAISANNGQRIYGIIDGSIHEWKFEAVAPLTWDYVGPVTTNVTS